MLKPTLLSVSYGSGVLDWVPWLTIQFMSFSLYCKHAESRALSPLQFRSSEQKKLSLSTVCISCKRLSLLFSSPTPKETVGLFAHSYLLLRMMLCGFKLLAITPRNICRGQSCVHTYKIGCVFIIFFSDVPLLSLLFLSL